MESRASVPTTLWPIERFESFSLELITLKICREKETRTLTHISAIASKAIMSANSIISPWCLSIPSSQLPLHNFEVFHSSVAKQDFVAQSRTRTYINTEASSVYCNTYLRCVYQFHHLAILEGVLIRDTSISYVAFARGFTEHKVVRTRFELAWSYSVSYVLLLPPTP